MTSTMEKDSELGRRGNLGTVRIVVKDWMVHDFCYECVKCIWTDMHDLMELVWLMDTVVIEEVYLRCTWDRRETNL